MTSGAPSFTVEAAFRANRHVRDFLAFALMQPNRMGWYGGPALIGIAGKT